MIKVSHLSKSYGRKQVLHDLSFEIPDGMVTGFLGPNGAGKTTTMRCVLGLDRPSAGGAHFFDGTREFNFPTCPNKAQVVGCLLDPTWFAPTRSARAHLLALAAGAGIPASRVDEVLGLVGMTDAAGKKMKTFSLGMKQRIGIAGALLGDPQYLFFDEPVNGLDPEGVRWVRDFVRQEAARGRGVLISSHLLAEMQQTADRVVVVGKGRLIGQYSMDEFLGSGSIVVQVDQAPRLMDALSQQNLQVTAQTPQRLEVAVPAQADEAAVRALISDICFRNGIRISEMTLQQQGLEERFLATTGEHVEFNAGSAT